MLGRDRGIILFFQRRCCLLCELLLFQCPSLDVADVGQEAAARVFQRVGSPLQICFILKQQPEGHARCAVSGTSQTVESGAKQRTFVSCWISDRRRWRLLAVSETCLASDSARSV